MPNVSCICLGTANFGLKYGSFKKNKILENEIQKILEYCQQYKINSIDTAFAYKNHSLIGDLKNKNWPNLEVNTKLPHLSAKKINYEKKIANLIDSALNDLKVNKLNIVYFHNYETLINENGDLIFSILNNLKDKGYIKKIGLSIYDTNLIKKIIKRYNLDVIQTPFNIVDQNLLRKNNLNSLKTKNVDIYIRSIFLQGIMLFNNLEIYKKNRTLYTFLKSIKKKIDSYKVDPYYLLVNFVLKYNFYNKIVIGVDNLNQLKKFHKSRKLNVDINYSNFFSSNKNIIHPYKWNLNSK